MAQTKNTPKELMTLTVAELRSLAKKNSVELKSSLKAEIAKELAKALQPKKEPKQKAPVKKAAAPKAAAPKAAAPKKQPGTKKKAAAKMKTVTAPETGDLSSMTVAELRALASKNSLELRSKLKAEMVKELTKALKPDIKPKQKAPVKKTVAKKAPTGKKPVKTKEKTMAKTVTKKPEQDQGAQKKVAPKAPPPEKSRTSSPLGTVPPRAPRSPEEKSAVRKAEKPRPWSPKTPNTITGSWASAIPVDPGRLFVSWDIEQGEVKHGRRLVLRVLDITEPQERPASFIQVPVKSLSGGLFVSVTRGRSYRAVIGTMGMDGDFIALVAADPIATPTGEPSEGTSLLGEEHFLSGTPSGKDPLSSY